MKVFIAVLLVIGSVAARGSGPYLPSGWRPDGPSFLLPSEVAKPAPRANQELAVEETEASGSDALKEYGPPNLEVALDVNQGLPAIATEQTFLKVINIEEVSGQEAAVEANTEQVAAIIEQVSTVTESLTESDSADVVPTALIEESVVPLSEQELVQDAVPTSLLDIAVPVTLLEQELSDIAPTTAEEVIVGRTVEGVNNIAEAIVALEKDVTAAEVQVNDNTAEITAKAISGSSAQVPEGFLEYGPPGFLEYGPPKQQVTPVTAEASSAFENNEVRRRRFSPKLRSTKHH